MSSYKSIAIILALASLAVATKKGSNLAQWEAWKEKHGKDYSSHVEEIKRYNIFMENVIKVEIHNYEAELGLHTYDLEINHYADLTSEEFKSRMNGYLSSDRKKHYRDLSNVGIPDSMDWRQKGAVTPVKNQGSCGSCWAFSATGSLEGMSFLNTNKSVLLSEQNLIDCSSKFGNDGCNGGLMDHAFKYIMANHGLESEKDYPYEAVDGVCKYNSFDAAVKVSTYYDIQHGSELHLKAAVGIVGPISVGIDAGSSNFQFYKSGVYTDDECSSEYLDHGVLVVGYGRTESNVDYWIVKNSWSTKWGDEGYIKMARNRNNMCGIATSASYPVVL